MGRVAPIQNSFIGGILARSMRGRADTEKYHASAEDILNMHVTPHGGAFRRPGTYFAAEAKYKTKLARLIEFEFSTTQAYIIELGDGYMRFFRNGGPIADPTDYVVNGTFNTDVSSWNDISTGTATMAWDGVGAMELTADAAGGNIATGEQAITFVTADSKLLIQFDTTGADVEINIGTASGLSDIYASGALAAGTHNIEVTPSVATIYLQFEWAGAASGTRLVDNVIVNRDVYEIASPYLEAELSEVQFAQSADVLFMVYGGRPVQALSRFDHDDWTMADYPFNEGPYTPTNYVRNQILYITGGPPWTKGSTLNLRSDVHAPFTSAMIGETFRIESETDNTIYAWGTITVFNSTISVDFEAGDDIPTELQGVAFKTFKWNFSAFTAALGYPSVVNLAGQRLFFGRTTTYPQTFWGSVPVALDNYTFGIDPDHCLQFTLASRKPHTLQWLAAAGKKLLAGTQGGEWSIAGSNDIITPTTLHVDPEGSRGNASVMPIEAGRALLAVQKYGKKLREIKYSFDADGYVSTDLTIMAEHLGRDSDFIDLTYQPDENSIVWVVRADGQMVACTYEPDHNVVAWHRHTTNGLIESVASIPGTIEDEVWMIVLREINGVETRFVEQMQPTTFSGIENAFFVDCGLSYVGELLPVSAASVADPCVVRVDANLIGTAPIVDNTVSFADVVGMTELNGNKYDITAVAFVSGTLYDLTLELDSTAFTAYTSGGTAQYGIKTVTGLDHLEGEAVDVLADGSPDAGTVSSGSITLVRGAAVIHVGLNYISQLKLLPPDAGAQNGTSLGKLKRWNELRVLFHETIGCKINEKVVSYGTLNAEMGKPLDLFTGFKRATNLGWDREGIILIEQEQPLPMNVLAVTGTLTTNDS